MRVCVCRATAPPDALRLSGLRSLENEPDPISPLVPDTDLFGPVFG